MSEDKVYAVVMGVVQAFTKDGVKQPAVKVGNGTNGNVVYNLTIQTAKQSYVDLAFWAADFGDAPASIQEGTFLAVKGSITKTPKQNGGEWVKCNVFTASGVKPMAKLARDPVNQQAAPAVAPAATAPAEAAPAAAAPSYDF